MTALENTPTNPNFLSPLNFKFSIIFSCQLPLRVYISPPDASLQMCRLFLGAV